jgi:hypothetical protein
MKRGTLASIYPLVLCTILFTVVIGSRLSQATLMGALTLPELIENSSLIVEGRVTKIRSELTADGKAIVSYIDIAPAPAGIVKDEPEVNADLKRVGTTVTLKLLGGTVDIITPEGRTEKRTLYVVGNPGFKPDEEVLVFVRPGKGQEFSDFFGLVAMAQGKYRIENGIAKRSVDGITFVGPKPEKRLDELPLADLKTEIRQEVQRQPAEQQKP